jgi:hypothetical protein
VDALLNEELCNSCTSADAEIKEDGKEMRCRMHANDAVK